MTYRVVITRRAEREMQEAAGWWARERSAEEAARWLTGLGERLDSLAQGAMRCPWAAENGQFPFEIRELYYGLGRRPTHRAVFTIVDEFVLVLTVRHVAQGQLQPGDLGP